jgi:hypothetical protein
VKAETLQQVIKKEPFRPFTLTLPSGRDIRVDHPEWIAFAGGRTAIVTDPEDRIQFIEVMLVDLLELPPPIPAGSPAPDPNGQE